MTSDPNSPDGIDTEGKAVPPYDGRKESADVEGKDKSTQEGVKAGGASALVEDDDMKSPDPDDTPGGATGSPADEQPASEASESDLDDDKVGPGHEGGTARAEDQP